MASSFCGSSAYNSSYVNNNNNQGETFLKISNIGNNNPTKDNAKKENKGDNNIINNSFDNNSLSKDTSLFINDDNDDKDLNFKNLVSILNKKFKSYLSKEKLNKTEIVNKNAIIKNDLKNNKSINNIKPEDYNDSCANSNNNTNKNKLFNSFTNYINTQGGNNFQNKNNNGYLLFSYSKNAKNNKIEKINQTSIKYNQLYLFEW